MSSGSVVFDPPGTHPWPTFETEVGQEPWFVSGPNARLGHDLDAP